LEERDPDLLLEKNKGSCTEKHLFLGKEFKKLGVPVRYLLIKFDWNDLPIPKGIISQKEGSSVSWHSALKIKPKDKWIYVDATWDPKLAKAGFPVTKNWDGNSDTKLAVPPKKIIELRIKPPRTLTKCYFWISKRERLDNRQFYEALNKWLEFKRRNAKH